MPPERVVRWFRFVRTDGRTPMHPLSVDTPIEAWDLWERVGNDVDRLARIEVCEKPKV